MVEVTVKVEGSGVFVAGDNLHCQLTFHNSQSDPQTIAWVGAQIHCQRLVRESVLKLNLSDLQLSSPISDTAFFPNRGNCIVIVFVVRVISGERGKSIVSTRSTVLLCNVTINPSETKTGLCVCVLSSLFLSLFSFIH